jgi:hypothetical protein
MKQEKIRVRAKPHAHVQLRTPEGALVQKRFVGRDLDGEVIETGEDGLPGVELVLTPRNRHDYLRAIADGDLEKLAEVTS